MPPRKRNRRRRATGVAGEGGQSSKRTEEDIESLLDGEAVAVEMEQTPEGKAFMETFQKLGCDLHPRDIMRSLKRKFELDLAEEEGREPEPEPEPVAEPAADPSAWDIFRMDEEDLQNMVKEKGLEFDELCYVLGNVMTQIGEKMFERLEARMIAKEEAAVAAADKAAAELIEEEDARAAKEGQRGVRKDTQTKSGRRRQRNRRGVNAPGREKGLEGGTETGEEDDNPADNEQDQQDDTGGETEGEQGINANPLDTGGTDQEGNGEDGTEDERGWETVKAAQPSSTKTDPKVLARTELNVGMTIFAPSLHQTDEETFEMKKDFAVRHRDIGFIYGKYRPYIIIGLYSDHIIALPCYTFGGHGLQNKRIGLEEFVSIFDHRKGSIEDQRANQQGEHKPLITRYIPKYIGHWHPLCVIHICEPESFSYRTRFSVQGCLDQGSIDELFELYRKYLPYKAMAAVPWEEPTGPWRGGFRGRAPNPLGSMLGSWNTPQRGVRGPVPRGTGGRWIRGGRLSEFTGSQIAFHPDFFSSSLLQGGQGENLAAPQHQDQSSAIDSGSTIEEESAEGPTATYPNWPISNPSSTIMPIQLDELERLCDRTHIIGEIPLQKPPSRSQSPSHLSEVREARNKQQSSELSKNEPADHNRSIFMSRILRKQATKHWKDALAFYKRDPTEERFEAIENAEEICEWYVKASEQMLQKALGRIELRIPIVGAERGDLALFY